MATIINGVKYSFDCKNCAFHKFMEMFGFNANKNTCWIDCTSDIQKNIDATFNMILAHTYENQEGAILYTGNVDTNGVPS